MRAKILFLMKEEVKEYLKGYKQMSTCGTECDNHVNCSNVNCTYSFNDGQEKIQNCCSNECIRVTKLSLEEQRELRKGKQNKKCIVIKVKLK